jgi:3-phenylpropionate/trans-cinnamate dioxygenase ferredoxin subunit
MIEEEQPVIEFFKAAELDDLEEDGLYPIEVDGEPVCLAKIDGSIYAFTNSCTHVSGPLNEGKLEGCILTCPWHGSRFDIRTGQVMRGPARQNLAIFPVKIDGISIMIGLPAAEE